MYISSFDDVFKYNIMKEMTEIQQDFPSEERLRDMADLYKIFSDYSRIKLLCLLREKELCVFDITQLMDINQSAVSNQLRILRNSGLIKFRREGKNTYYSLYDDHVEKIIRLAMEHCDELAEK